MDGEICMRIDINTKMNELRSTQRLVNSVIQSQLKASGIEKEKVDDSDSVMLDLSQEGILMSENSIRQEKEVGKSSLREEWEDNTIAIKRQERAGTVGHVDLLEVFRLDEPETYAKYTEWYQKTWELYHAGLNSEEEKLAYYKASHEEAKIYFDWYYRRCLSTGTFKNPVNVQFTALNTLETMYSDSEHDISFNYYGRVSDPRASMWRYNSKFNVLISADMFNRTKLLDNLGAASDKDRKELNDIMETIDKSVRKMKQAEKDYEGDLEYLRFGVKIWDDGRVTYHAKYKDCENDDGIMADSTEELLEKLMSKE